MAQTPNPPSWKHWDSMCVPVLATLLSIWFPACGLEGWMAQSFGILHPRARLKEAPDSWLWVDLALAIEAS